MQVNNAGKVSFGTQVKISSDDMFKIQQVANPYFSRIAGDIKALQDDQNKNDVLAITNVSVREGKDETGFVADLVLYSEDKIEFKTTQNQINIHGMESSDNKGRLSAIHADLKSKLTDILAIASKIVK